MSEVMQYYCSDCKNHFSTNINKDCQCLHCGNFKERMIEVECEEDKSNWHCSHCGENFSLNVGQEVVCPKCSNREEPIQELGCRELLEDVDFFDERNR